MAGKADKKTPPDEELVVRNARAVQRYEIEEKLEAGIALMGSEVKSLRQRRAQLEGAFVTLKPGNATLHGLHIQPYVQAATFGHEPARVRKLLMHAREIERWMGRLSAQGYTVVPIRVYFKKGLAKVELGLGRGKKAGDEREKIKRATDLKEARAMIQAGKGKRVR